MKISFTLLLVLISRLLAAQIQIVAEQDQDRNLTLLGLNSSNIPYTVQIEFSSLENLKSMNGELILEVVQPGKSKLVQLQSIYTNEKTSFRYNTKVFKGEILATVDSEFLYLAPLEENITYDIRPLKVDGQRGNNLAKPTYTGAIFTFNTDSNICAPRKGIVSEIRMNRKDQTKGPTDFDKENYVEIYHSDGSFSRLSGLAPSSTQVEVGQTIFPGDPIAKAQKTDSLNHYMVKMIQSRWVYGAPGIEWINFPVKIKADQIDYPSSEKHEQLTSLHPEDILIKEMDKKELKRFNKRK